MDSGSTLSTIRFGDRRLIGQPNVREQLQRSVQSGRLSHAWLFSGPEGSGKTAFALAFAELLAGIDNLTDLGGSAQSRKPSWFRHPDIHLFIPLPKTVADSETSTAHELKERFGLLERDPYEMISFARRPTLSGTDSTKNRQAFYPIGYFHKVIRKRCHLRPGESRYTIVILTGIETMRLEAANAFLKLLEEPPPHLIFLLTTSAPDRLLATIHSRCRQIRLDPLSGEEIARALESYDGRSPEESDWLARIANGNYSLARNLDPVALRKSRSEIVGFLRSAYTLDAAAILKTVQEWSSGLNTENQIALCKTLELFLRDLLIYRQTGNDKLVGNADQLDVIRKFCDSLQKARLDEMIAQVEEARELISRNIQFKVAFTALSFRFSSLMRGLDPAIPDAEPWRRLPALATET